MNIHPIKNDSDYRAALKSVSTLFDDPPSPNSPAGDRFDVMVTLIEAYEAKHFPMDLGDAVDAIKFRMEQAGLTVKDLEPAIGRSSRVYEVLNGKRKLSLTMIRHLNLMFGIPIESLVHSQKAA